MGVVVDGAVLGERRARRLRVLILNRAAQQDQSRLLRHHRPVCLAPLVLIAHKLAGQGHEPVIAVAVAKAVERFSVLVDQGDRLFPKDALSDAVLHVVGAEVEIRDHVILDQGDHAVAALNDHIAAFRVRHEEVTALPILRRDEGGVHLGDGFLHIGAIVQHIAQQHAGRDAHPGRPVPLLDVQPHDGDEQSLFIDAVHTLIGQHIQHGHLKALHVRPPVAEHWILLIAPHGIRDGDGFVLALGLAVQDDVQPGERLIVPDYAVGIVIIPA